MFSKTAPSMEYIQYGARNALELKTLFVVNPAKNSGKGIGSELENRINEIAREKFDNLQVTVSEEKKESLQFFMKKGWEVQKGFPNKYTEGATEFLLTKKVQIHAPK